MKNGIVNGKSPNDQRNSRNQKKFQKQLMMNSPTEKFKTFSMMVMVLELRDAHHPKVSNKTC
jgi:hypothetical protein